MNSLTQLEAVTTELRKTEAFLRQVMGEAIEDCGLLESVALLASQRENARNAHAKTQERCDKLKEFIENARAYAMEDNPEESLAELVGGYCENLLAGKEVK